jgi:hypothetical protein
VDVVVDLIMCLISKSRIPLLFALLCLIAIPATAGLPPADIEFTAVDNQDGTLTIGYSALSGKGPAVIGFSLQDCNDVVLRLDGGSGAFDLIRFIDPNSPEGTPFGLMSALVPGSAIAQSQPNLVTIDFGGAAGGMIDIDPGRGGVVDSLGNGLVNNLPLPFTVTSVCQCFGDVSDSEGLTPNPDGVIDLGDFNFFLSRFGASDPDFVIQPVPAELLCADITGASGTGIDPDGQIDFGDFNFFLEALSAANVFIDGCIE